MQMSKVGNRESGKAAKIIGKKFGSFRKNLYLCNIVAKMTLATKICGIANGKNFVNHGARFS